MQTSIQSEKNEQPETDMKKAERHTARHNLQSSETAPSTRVHLLARAWPYACAMARVAIVDTWMRIWAITLDAIVRV